jgi:hypothetical protein
LIEKKTLLQQSWAEPWNVSKFVPMMPSAQIGSQLTVVNDVKTLLHLQVSMSLTL